jgi:hypothetical protein
MESATKYSMPYYIVEYRRPALWTFYFLWMLLTLWFILCLTRISYYSGNRIVWIALIPFPNETATSGNVTEAEALVNDTSHGNFTNLMNDTTQASVTNLTAS